MKALVKLSDYVVDFIADMGVRHVFVLPGGGAMHLNDSLGASRRLNYVCVLHEQAGAIAAEAYGQCSGMGVLMVTSGPGGTNAITGVAGAWLESTPMLVISGQVKGSDISAGTGVRQIGFQEIDIVRLVGPITKFAKTVTDPKSIKSLLQEAAWLAVHGRKGPVWIDIPLDVQAAEIDPGILQSFGPPADLSVDITAIESAAERTVSSLMTSRRPLLLIGNGVRHAGALNAVLRWAESIGIQIATTWKTLDILPDDHPLLVGRPGLVGQRAANFAQQTSDLLLSIGARLDLGQTAYNHKTFAPRARKIVVDIDQAEIGKLRMDIAISLAADAGLFVDALKRRSQDLHFPDWRPWRKCCTSWRTRFPVVTEVQRQVQDGVNTYALVEAIGRLLKSGDIIVPGSSGACSEVTSQALRVPDGVRFINTHGLGAMGFGVPAAVGACLAFGVRRTVCIDGDGGFVMNSQELAVVSRLALPIKFFVLDNGGYGSIRTTQENYFKGRYVACDEGSGLTLPNLKSLAQSADIPFTEIEDHAGLAKRLIGILSTPGAVICRVRMAPNQSTQPRVSSRQLPDGRMETMPMEDLWPFLPRAELAAILREAEEIRWG